MNYNLFLLPFFISFTISTLVLVVLIVFSQKFTAIDIRYSNRHLHKKGISRFGGVALIVSFIITLLIDEKLVISAPLVGVLFGSGAILILGIIDDVKQISWKIQFFFQFAIVIAVYITGVRLQYMTNPLGGILIFQDSPGLFLGLLISVFWLVFMMNAINWVDGIDGVAGGITFIGGATIFLLSLNPEVNQPPVGIIAAALLGGLISLIFFNFYPAKILAGSSGSIFMGYILAVMAIFAGAKIATTLLVMAVPIIDALWVIGERIKAGDSIFSADKRHLHFKLLELGWSHKKIAVFYYALTIVVAFIALNTHMLGKVVGFILIAVFLIGVLFVIQRRFSTDQKFKIYD